MRWKGVWQGHKIVWSTVQILLLASLANAQEVSIPRGSLIQLIWTAPPDSDVVRFDAFFISVFGDTSKLAILTWSALGDGSGASSYMTGIQLPIGSGKLMMTATDAAGNQSAFSDPPAFYRVIDASPGAPKMIIIKVL